MKRFVRVPLFVCLMAAICVLHPLKASVEAKWIALGGNGQANPYSIQVTDAGPTVLRLQISINGFELESASESDTQSKRVTLTGLAPIEEAGAPDLPHLVRALRVPDGGSPRFDIVEENERTFNNIQIVPSRGPILIGEDASKKRLVKGGSFKVNDFFPPKVFDLIEPFQMRDTKGVKFVFAPFRYNPVRRELQIITRLVVDVSFDPIAQTQTAGSEGPVGDGAVNGHKHRRSPAFDRIEATLFLNGATPTVASGLPDSLQGPGLMSTPGAAAGSGADNMLIITTSKYSAALQGFIQWKQSQGMDVELDTTSASGGVSAIQNKILTKYDTEGVTYVLLVGGIEDVPSPMVTLISHNASDPSYVLLSGSNTVASAIISRIPADNVTQLQVQLAKIMYYGQTTINDDSWVNHALVGACTSNPNDTGEANTLVSAMLAHPSNFTVAERVLDTDAKKTNTVINAFEDLGINMFTYVGHGTETSMLSLGFSTTQAKALTGGNRAYPFVHTVACLLGNFGYSGGDCFAEAILKAGTVSAPAGAVAIAASTEDMYAGDGDRGQQIAFTNYYYSTQYETLGSLFFSSTAYAVSCLTGSLAETLYRQWHLFGDGSLPLQKVSGQTPSVSISAPAQVGEGAGLLAGQGTVTLSQAATSELIVSLSSSIPDIASVPVTVIVPAGATQASFDIDAPDIVMSGDQAVQICASIPGWLSGCSQMEILEPDGSQVAFSSASYVGSAGSGSIVITLLRTGNIRGAISVNLQTSDGTARAGSDYTAETMTVNFADGQTQATVAIPITITSHENPSETFNVSLSGTFAGSANSAVVTIPSNYNVDYFTEGALSGANLSFRSLSLVPDGSVNFYSACVSPVTTFFTDPTGGIPLMPGNNGYARVDLAGGATVSLYGSSYPTLFVGSNGYITFSAGDTTSLPSLQSHFLLPRISALFDDLDPSAGGSVSWKQLADRVAITFQNVPEKGSDNSNSFQVEIFFNGAIRITWMGIQASSAMIGLSAGQGQVPSGFVESDLSAYAACSWQVVLNLIGTLGTVDGNAGLLKSAGTVAVQAPLFFNLSVNLSSSDATRLSVPATVIIQAGQTQAQFDVTVIGDCKADGDHSVTVTALSQNGVSVNSSIIIQGAGAIPGDLNGNCIVNFDDLNILLGYLGKPAQDCPSCDLNGDGIIDANDVNLLKSWCTCSGCVCADTQQRTDPTSSQPVSVPALGEYGLAALACVLIFFGCGSLRIRCGERLEDERSNVRS